VILPFPRRPKCAPMNDNVGQGHSGPSRSKHKDGACSDQSLSLKEAGLIVGTVSHGAFRRRGSRSRFGFAVVPWPPGLEGSLGPGDVSIIRCMTGQES